MMNLSEQLLADIDAFLGVTKMTPTRFGLDAAGDGKIIPKLRKGRTITLDKADRIRKYMADNPPAQQAAE